MNTLVLVIEAFVIVWLALLSAAAIRNKFFPKSEIENIQSPIARRTVVVVLYAAVLVFVCPVVFTITAIAGAFGGLWSGVAPWAERYRDLHRALVGAWRGGK